MGFWSNSQIGRYFGVSRYSENSNGNIVNKEIDNGANMMDLLSIGVPVDSYYPKDFKFLEISERNYVVGSVLAKISKRVSNAMFQDESGEESELLKKINKPNKIQTKGEFLTEFTVNLLSYGLAIWFKKYKSFGNFETMELINIDPYTFSIEGDKVYFSHENENYNLNKSDVMLFFDSRIDKETSKGYSRLIPLRTQVENINVSQKAKYIQIQNSGTTIVSPKQAPSNNSIDEGLNAPVPQPMGRGVKSQKQQMEENLGGRGIENRIIVSSKGLDATNLSEKLNTVDFNKIIEPDALSIFDAYNFPPELSPFGASAKFDNKEVAELSLIESEVLPISENIRATLNQEFEGKGVLTVSFNHLMAMSVTRNRVIDTNQKIIEQYSRLLEIGAIDLVKFKDVMQQNNILE